MLQPPLKRALKKRDGAFVREAIVVYTPSDEGDCCALYSIGETSPSSSVARRFRAPIIEEHSMRGKKQGEMRRLEE